MKAKKILPILVALTLVTPSTGDGSHPALWYALALGSLAGIAALAVYGKKRAAK